MLGQNYVDLCERSGVPAYSRIISQIPECACPVSHHGDVIKWKHFPHNWPFVRGIHRSRWISPHKAQWRGALMISLICVWINGWINNREAGDLRHHRGYYDVIVMEWGYLWQVHAEICEQGLFCHCDRHTIAPVPLKQPWCILVNESRGLLRTMIRI